MSPLRKGSRCHAPALCVSQWRGWVYATFHLWDKEKHCSSCDCDIFRVFRAVGFDEINRRGRNFNYANCEVLDLSVEGTNKKENAEVLGRFCKAKFVCKFSWNWVWGHTKVVTVRRTVASFCKQKIEVSVRDRSDCWSWPWRQVVCEVLTGLFGNLAWFGISSLGWFLVRWRWKLFALLSSRTALSWRRWHRRRRVGALLFQPANAKSSPLPVRTESMAVHCCKKPSCMPLTKVQTLINWTSSKSKSRWGKNVGKSSWTERTNRTTVLNQLNHWIPHTKVRSRNEKFVREEGRPHELPCGYSRTCAIFFAPRPRAFTKIAIFVLQNVHICRLTFLKRRERGTVFATKSDRYDMENGWKSLNFEQKDFRWKFNKGRI